MNIEESEGESDKVPNKDLKVQGNKGSSQRQESLEFKA